MQIDFQKTNVTFGSLTQGEVFARQSTSSTVYMKTKRIYDSNGTTINAISLPEGRHTSFADSEPVYSRPNAILLVYGKLEDDSQPELQALYEETKAALKELCDEVDNLPMMPREEQVKWVTVNTGKARRVLMKGSKNDS